MSVLFPYSVSVLGFTSLRRISPYHVSFVIATAVERSREKSSQKKWKSDLGRVLLGGIYSRVLIGGETRRRGVELGNAVYNEQSILGVVRSGIIAS